MGSLNSFIFPNKFINNYANFSVKSLVKLSLIIQPFARYTNEIEKQCKVDIVISVVYKHHMNNYDGQLAFTYQVFISFYKLLIK
jgi:hypothetical protein